MLIESRLLSLLVHMVLLSVSDAPIASTMPATPAYELFFIEQVHSDAGAAGAWDNGPGPQVTIQKLDLGVPCSRSRLVGHLTRRIELVPFRAAAFLSVKDSRLDLPENSKVRELVTSFWTPPDDATPERSFGLADVSDDGRTALVYSKETRFNADETALVAQTSFRLLDAPRIREIASWRTEVSRVHQNCSGLVRGDGVICYVIEELEPGNARLMAVSRDGSKRKIDERNIVAVRVSPSRRAIATAEAVTSSGRYTVRLLESQSAHRRWERELTLRTSESSPVVRIVWEQSGESVLLFAESVSTGKMEVYGLSAEDGRVVWQTLCTGISCPIDEPLVVKPGTPPRLAELFGVEVPITAPGDVLRPR